MQSGLLYVMPSGFGVCTPSFTMYVHYTVQRVPVVSPGPLSLCPCVISCVTACDPVSLGATQCTRCTVMRRYAVLCVCLRPCVSLCAARQQSLPQLPAPSFAGFLGGALSASAAQFCTPPSPSPGRSHCPELFNYVRRNVGPAFAVALSSRARWPRWTSEAVACFPGRCFQLHACGRVLSRLH